MLTKLKLTATILFFSAALLAQADYQTDYIEQYKDIAIQEMERAGIPASIKLAQAILESDAGRSKLARKANNHFGIKCGGNWTGKTYDKKDDDYDDRGKLVKSCFRSYKKAEESFIAHSEFLRDPSKEFRYGFLFRLDPMDYERWAKGLKRAGYATSATYARKLIDIIERFKLYEYDQMALPAGDRPVVTQPDEDVIVGNNDSPDPSDPNVTITRVLVVNDVKMVYAQAGETVQNISSRTDTPVSSILRYNENVLKGDEVLPEGTRVYLQDKRSSYRGRDKWHYVKAGEDMFDISQIYAVDLEKLYERNNMEFGTEAAVGEKILLRGRRSDTPKLRSEAREEAIVENDAPIFDTNEDGQVDMIDEDEEETIEEVPQPKVERPIVERPQPKLEPKEPELEDPIIITLPREGEATLPASNPNTSPARRPVYGTIAQAEAEAHVSTGVSTTTGSNTSTVQAETRMYHDVQRGDTLYSLSRKYNTTVDEIKTMNGLSSNVLSIGQQLRVK